MTFITSLLFTFLNTKEETTLLKDHKGLIEYQGDFMTPKELALLLDVDFDTYELK